MTSPIDIRPDHLAMVQDILRAHLPHGAQAWVFGSRATWATKDSSDLDLAVQATGKIDRRVMGGLEDAFRESDLPYTVDVIDLAAVDGQFKQVVESQKVSLPVGLDGDEVGVTRTHGSCRITVQGGRTEEWDHLPLGSLVSNLDSRRIPLSKRVRATRAGPYPYYGATGVMDYVDDYLFEGLHLLVAEDGSVETSAGAPILQLVDGRFWVNNHAHVLQGSVDEDTRYLYYALSTVDVRPFVSGSVQAKVSQSNLNRIPVLYPDEASRRAVVQVLGTLDDKIDLNRRMNETLEEMARAIFKSWFVDYDPVRAKMEGRWRRGESLPGLPADLYDLFPARLVDSELGEVPEGWEVRGLGECLSAIVSGQRPRGGAVESGVPSIGAENIIGLGRYNFTSEKYVPVDFFPKLKDKGADVRNGDVLLYKDGAHIGRKTYFDRSFPHSECAVNEHVLILRMQEPAAQRHLFFWLDQPWMTQEIVTLNSNSAQPGINQTAVRGLPLLVPPTSLLAAFDRVAGAMTDRIFANCHESRTLGALRDILLPRLVSGEVGVASPHHPQYNT